MSESYLYRPVEIWFTFSIYNCWC